MFQYRPHLPGSPCPGFSTINRVLQYVQSYVYEMNLNDGSIDGRRAHVAIPVDSFFLYGQKYRRIVQIG